MVEIEEATEIARAHPAAAIRLAFGCFFAPYGIPAVWLLRRREGRAKPPHPQWVFMQQRPGDSLN